jgi:predicted esterase
MRSVVTCVLVVLCLASLCAAGWEEDLDRVLATEPGEERDALVASVAEAAPGWEEIAARITGRVRPDATTGTFLLSRVCTDEVERPWVLVVPEGYDPAKPTPLLVSLHGLVTRPEVMPDAKEYAERMLITKLARDRSWLVAYPMGQQGATWFDPVGMENLREIVRTVKRTRNVDDDRVWMAGFSDGGSAAFLHAMADPNDYGAFLALNCHMGVGSHIGKIDTFAVNFANTPVYVMTSDRDALYATAKMRPSIEMAIAAGGRILFRQFSGAHDLRHVHPELANLGDYLERHPRDPFPGRIVWETGDPERFGLCRWLRIDAVSDAPRAPWHEDHNATVAEDRVTIGFNHAEHEGEGVKVAKVIEGTFAEKAGLAAGDVIVRMNGAHVRNLDDLNAAKAKVARGDPVELVVLRDGEETTLAGNLPPVERYWILHRERRSALARATFSANRVVVEASRIGALRVLVHPALVNLDERLVVTVNGEKLFDDYVEPDAEYLVRNYLENRDRTLLWVAEVRVEVPVR